LTEGKFSFPVIHAIHTRREDPKISHILKQRTKNADLKRYFVSLLEEYGSLKYTVNALQDLEKEIRTEIQALGGNQYLTALLDELTQTKKKVSTGNSNPDNNTANANSVES